MLLILNNWAQPASIVCGYLLQDGMPLGNGVVAPPPFPENLGELMNSPTAPNVTLQVSERAVWARLLKTNINV